MFDEWLRLYKDRLLGGMARRLGGLSPNTVTLLAGVVGLAAAGAITVGQRGLALALWLASRVLDGLDGTMARVHGRSTDFGAYLDILLDFVVYAAIPLALAAAAPPDARYAALVLLASFYVNAASWMYLAALLERRGVHSGATRVVMPAGLVAGTETIVLYSAAIILPAHFEVICWVMAALVSVGIVQRLVWARRRM